MGPAQEEDWRPVYTTLQLGAAQVDRLALEGPGQESPHGYFQRRSLNPVSTSQLTSASRLAACFGFRPGRDILSHWPNALGSRAGN